MRWRFMKKQNNANSFLILAQQSLASEHGFAVFGVAEGRTGFVAERTPMARRYQGDYLLRGHSPPRHTPPADVWYANVPTSPFLCKLQCTSAPPPSTPFAISLSHHPVAIRTPLTGLVLDL
ncbi:hypothetical protein Tco_1070082 [Tanacetum coccineum]|uniref:Uncharacterized protein n=1 Tax=Tanacetum coccineum TaxID=301880 RepID=A0ABQ5HM91_9ASTR